MKGGALLEEDVSPADLAEAMGHEVTEHTIRRLCRDGFVPGARLIGRSWRIPFDKAQEFLAEYERYQHRKRTL